MAQQLIDILRPCGPNSTGVVEVKLVLPDQVASYTDPVAAAGIRVKPGAKVYHLEIDARSGYHSERLQDGKHGEYHEQRVGFDLRRLRQDVATLRRRLRHQRVHVIFTDRNDETYLFLNHRLRAADGDNPTSGKNHTRLEFRGASKLPAMHFAGRLLPGPPEDDVDTTTGPPDDVQIDEPGDGGGVPGGGSEDDIGGGDPNPPAGGGGGGGGNPDNDNVIARILQPSTGNYLRLLADECGLPYTTPE